MARAFTTFVRPTLEYASTTWSPSKVTQILFLDKVQQNFTKRLPGLTNVPYSERLKILNLQSLEHRRLIIDLTETFKIINNLSSLKFDDFFSVPSYSLPRGHSFRLIVPFAATNVRKHFFFMPRCPSLERFTRCYCFRKSNILFQEPHTKCRSGKFLIFPTVYT